MSLSRFSLRWLVLAAWVTGVGLLAIGGTPGATARQEATPAAPVVITAAQQAQVAEMITAAQTEAFAAMNVKEYHDAGLKGAGIKIAVLETSYSGLQARIADGELPNNMVLYTFNGRTGAITDGVSAGEDDPGTPCDEYSNHGVAVAEIIHDIAPEAQLYLVQLVESDAADMRPLMERLHNEGVRIVSVSLAFGRWRGDGSGPGYDLFEDVRHDYNMLFVEGAGNYRRSHYSADFSDADGDNRHEFRRLLTIEVEKSRVKAIGCNDLWAMLTWDDWGGANQATAGSTYNVRLLDKDGNVVAEAQPSAAPGYANAPKRELTFKWGGSENTSQDYYLEIVGDAGNTRSHRLDLLVTGTYATGGLQYVTEASSLSAYSDSPHVFAIGAANWKTRKMEPYSSLGPTTGNQPRLKPDITGYAVVTTASAPGFNGTSAATPHVSGAAALLLQANPAATADQLAALLMAAAEDKGDAGPDNEWGAGLVRLPALRRNVTILAPTTAAPDAVGNPAAPVKTLLEIAVTTGGGAPWGGLRAADFAVTVGGRAAVVTTARQVAGRYLLEIVPPAQSAPGLYDLVVSHAGQTATQAGALNYTAVGANRADVMLILDRSGSMGGAPLAAAKGAATQFVGLMQAGDAVGVGSYDDTAQLNYPLTPISDDTIKTAAQSAVNAIFVGGNTSIGAGLVTGRDQLLGRGASEHAWAIVLLSDGVENTPPSVDDVLPTITPTKIKLFTIGLGNVNEPLMSRMAQETGGSYYYAPSPGDLSRIYNSIAGEVAGRQTLYSRTAAVNAGDTISFLALVDSSVREAIFAINWSDPGDELDLRLLDPAGRRIDPAAAAADPAIDFVSGATYAYYVVRQPDPGDWTLEIAAAATARDGDDQVGFDISVQAVADLTLELTTGAANHTAGDPIHLLLSLADDAPLTGASILINIVRPDNGVDLLSMADDGQNGDGLAGDGVYGAFYYRSNVAGTYRFLVQAFGNAGSEHYERRAELAVAVSAAGDADGDGMPDAWEIWHGLEPLRNDAAEDADIDDLINLDEFRQGTDPWLADSDADRLLDGDEVHTHFTQPRLEDTDGGGVIDGDEVERGSDPLDGSDDTARPASVLLPAVLLQFTPTPTPTATETRTPTPHLHPNPHQHPPPRAADGHADADAHRLRQRRRQPRLRRERRLADQRQRVPGGLLVGLRPQWQPLYAHRHPWCGRQSV